MTQFAKSFIQKHNQKLQVILAGLIFCVGIYGIWTKNNALIGATTITFASVGLFFQPKSWQNIVSSILFGLSGVGVIVGSDILQAMIFAFIFIGVLSFLGII